MTADVIFYAVLALVVVAAVVALSVTGGCDCALCAAKRQMRRAWRWVR